ncbi:hypothetical protein JCM3765_003351 [Sporobolomyces pararoseus]
MSSGALASHFTPGEAVPKELLYSLTQVVYAAGCVNFFLFAFLVFHAHLYLREEGWKNDNWFFRTIVSQLVILSVCSIGLSSAAAHWVLKSLFLGEYFADQLNWIDVISDSRVVWLLCLLLWVPAGVGCGLAEVFHILTVANYRNGTSRYGRTYYSFFLLILPNAWSLSVIWAINQRVLIKRKMKSTISDDASFAQRLEVVGWRNHVSVGQGAGMVESRRGSIGIDPSRWRGDDDTESHSSYRRTWRTQKKPTEPDYGSLELDTTPLDALNTPPHETRVSGIWVKTETKIESAPA